MPPSTPCDTFYGSIPVFRGFTSLMDPALYSPLPGDWTVGVADIVESTKAIAAQRYKAVNMAGASVIASVTNALDGREFPFVFGGDGASFAVASDDLASAREALAATTTWVKEDLDLSMRVALVPVTAIRAQGLDVRVARFGPSANLSYAMFSGGGLGWAEAAMKRGEFAVVAAPPGTQPDLSGLSCRFEEIPAARGLILSVLVVPSPGADPNSFRKVIEDIIGLVERSPDAGRPVPPGGCAGRRRASTMRRARRAAVRCRGVVRTSWPTRCSPMSSCVSASRSAASYRRPMCSRWWKIPTSANMTTACG
jgi:hypothetical protein